MSQLAIPQSKTAGRGTITAMLRDYFYFFMWGLMVIVIVYGFSHTIDHNLIHPAEPRPSILYVHAAVFTAWLAFFILQSALVRTGNVRLHRAIGLFGMALGGTIPIVGVWTAIVMTHFDTVQLHQTDAELFMIVPLWDMVVFATAFSLAMYLRKRPEFHRRLILIASCALTAAGFGRFPESILPSLYFYAGVDALILLGVARDLIVNHSVHRVYLYALPAIIIGQMAVMYTVVHKLPLWLKMSHAIAG